MRESDIVENDVLKGLTKKAFNMDYISTKELVFKYLEELCMQIKKNSYGEFINLY